MLFRRLDDDTWLAMEVLTDEVGEIGETPDGRWTFDGAEYAYRTKHEAAHALKDFLRDGAQRKPAKRTRRKKVENDNGNELDNTDLGGRLAGTSQGRESGEEGTLERTNPAPQGNGASNLPTSEGKVKRPRRKRSDAGVKRGPKKSRTDTPDPGTGRRAKRVKK